MSYDPTSFCVFTPSTCADGHESHVTEVTMIIHRLIKSLDHPLGLGYPAGTRAVLPLLDPRSLHRQLLDHPSPIVILDFASVGFVTASFLQAALLPFLSSDPVTIFPVVANAVPDVLNELTILCSAKQVTCLYALDFDNSSVSKARVLGPPIEPAAREALDSLCAAGPSTASSLRESSKNSDVPLRAWSNRLAYLHRMRLACRALSSRQWVYTPVANEFVHSAPPDSDSLCSEASP